MISRDDGRGRDPLLREVLFPFGQVVMTSGVDEHIPRSEMMKALRRHARGDWGDPGDIGAEDRQSNDQALREGERLVSIYRTEGGVKFYIITERDRSATTVLLPEEY